MACNSLIYHKHNVVKLVTKFRIGNKRPNLGEKNHTGWNKLFYICIYIVN